MICNTCPTKATPRPISQSSATKCRPFSVRCRRVGTATRSPALPDVPTVAELGYPGFEASLWLGVFAPAGTPRPIIDRLNKVLVEIVATDDFKNLMERNGADPVSNSPEQFLAMMRSELDRYGKVIKTLGLRLD
ncbi:MAG: hypothetical protein EBS52_10780 [Betaproteobacteria bacterium]|nr:hypothetical protein [Betaproteobacteria bacterium]